MIQLKASELQRYDCVLLTPGAEWVITSGAETDGPLTVFTARTKTSDGRGWLPNASMSLPAEMAVSVLHAWRDVNVPCILCRDTYPHHMDIAVTSDARGICGSCNTRTTAEALTDRRST